MMGGDTTTSPEPQATGGGGGEVEDRDKWRESWVHLKNLVYLAHLHTGLHHYACVEEGKVHDDMAELVCHSAASQARAPAAAYKSSGKRSISQPADSRYYLDRSNHHSQREGCAPRLIGSDNIAMGSLRVSTWAGPSSGFLSTGPASECRARRRPHPRCALPSASAPASLGAGRPRSGTGQEWLWDCRGGGRDYAREMVTAVRVVQVACTLCQRVQESLLRPSSDATGRVHAKLDRSPVTVADWGVQAIVSWLLSDSFHDENISIVAEEDDETLSSSDGVALLESVVEAVNDCLVEAPMYGLRSPEKQLGARDVIQAIQKCSSVGGSKGRFWVLDPVDGTLGFVRGDQYAIALALIEDGEVVLGVLGCPNYPMKKEWLSYHQKYYRLMSNVTPPSGSWHKGCVMYAQKGCGQAWMQPLVHDFGNLGWHHPREIQVSSISDPVSATFCEPVEKANSSHSFTAGLAHSVGLRKQPLRVYSMVKYAAIARGDAEIFMKFARAGYKEKIWDHAAGVVIIQEAGGMVTDAEGRPLDFSKGVYLEGLDRGIIACSRASLHQRIVDAVDASWNSSTL